jgi:hypothetical protein
VAESLHEQISAALKTRLESIEEDGGTTYWYTPDKVYRTLEFMAADLDDSLDYLLFLRPDNDNIRESTNFHIRGEAPFTVWIAKKDDRAGKSPLTEEQDEQPIAATVIGRCVADVRAVLLTDVTLTTDNVALAWNVMSGTSEADYSQPVEGWLCATVTFTVAYDYAA